MPNNVTLTPAEYQTLLAESAAAKARVAELEQALTAKAAKTLTCKVSEKGGVSVYGLGTWPWTTYLSQHLSIRAAWKDICGFFDAAQAAGMLAKGIGIESPEQYAVRVSEAQRDAFNAKYNGKSAPAVSTSPLTHDTQSVVVPPPAVG
jgi:hypothetical protein